MLTRSEQRRLAQKASVKARRRSAALRARQARQAEAEPRDQVRKGRAFLEARLPAHDKEASTPVPERMLWHPLTRSNPLLVNNAALEVFRALHGCDPQWARMWVFPYHSQRSSFHLPPKAWWRWNDGDLVLALQLNEVWYSAENPSAPYLHRVRAYYLRPFDLLEHHDRRPHHDMAWEAVAWEPVLRGDLSQPRLQAGPHDPLPPPLTAPVVRLDGLPVPSPLRLARRLVERWVTDEKRRRLPWAEGPIQAQAKE